MEPRQILQTGNRDSLSRNVDAGRHELWEAQIDQRRLSPEKGSSWVGCGGKEMAYLSGIDLANML